MRSRPGWPLTFPTPSCCCWSPAATASCWRWRGWAGAAAWAAAAGAAFRDRLAELGRRDLRVRDWTRTNANWFDAVQIEKRLMFIILTLIVAVAANPGKGPLFTLEQRVARLFQPAEVTALKRRAYTAHEREIVGKIVNAHQLRTEHLS